MTRPEEQPGTASMHALLAHKEEEERAREATALCLSGGGYRAMTFHAGVLRRLNESGVLSRLDFVSSVSGGSITAGILARAWKRLRFTDGRATNLDELVVDRVREMARRDLDVGSVLGGLLRPRRTISEQVAAASPSTSSATPPCRTCPTSRASSSAPPTSRRRRWSASRRSTSPTTSWASHRTCP